MKIIFLGGVIFSNLFISGCVPCQVFLNIGHISPHVSGDDMITSFPCFLLTIYGSAPNVVESLFSFLCFKSTKSSGYRSLSRALLFSSAKSAPFCFNLCILVSCLTVGVSRVSQLRNLHDLISLICCTGVWPAWLLYCCEVSFCRLLRPFESVQIVFFSALALLRALSKLLFCLSTSLFAWGQSGVEVQCSISFFFRKRSNSSDTNCVPLKCFQPLR